MTNVSYASAKGASYLRNPITEKLKYTLLGLKNAERESAAATQMDAEYDVRADSLSVTIAGCTCMLSVPKSPPVQSVESKATSGLSLCRVPLLGRLAAVVCPTVEFAVSGTPSNNTREA